MEIPQHVAIILDGNGRWAKQHGMPRNYGHTQGAKNVEAICREAWNMGIKYCICFFHRELEPPQRRSECLDEIAAELYEELH